MRRCHFNQGTIVVSKIVVITHEGDAHIPFVEPHLSSKLITIDPYQIFEKKELSYIFDGKETDISYKNKIITDVKSVWYRKPVRRGHAKANVPTEFKEYSKTATTNHIQMLRAQFPNAY